MHAILADIGNSSIKLVIVDCQSFVVNPENVFRLDTALTSDSWKPFLEAVSHAAPARCFVSSVNSSTSERFLDHMNQLLPSVDCCVLSTDDLALESDVQSRQKLGIDRLLAATAAVWFARDESNEGPVIVVDAGTAVTIDLVDPSDVFRGGVIFPGAETSFGSLHRSTGALPNLAAAANGADLEQAIGDSTETAIVVGVMSAQAFAIKGIVDRIAETVDVDPVVIATGGGIEPIRSLLPDEWRYVDHLVLHGIAQAAKQLDLA